MADLPYAAFQRAFQRTADGLAALYGGPVLLVGGALEDVEPRDYDVRVVVAAEELHLRYGRPMGWHFPTTEVEADVTQPWEWRQYLDERKQSLRLSRRFRLPIDFQVWDDYEEAKAVSISGRTGVRLDAAPARLFDSRP